MPRPNCFAPNCDKLTGQNKFNMVPLDVDRRRFWFKAVGRNDFKSAPRFLFACSGHCFDQDKTEKSVKATIKSKPNATNIQVQQQKPTTSAFAQHMTKDTTTTMDQICRLCLKRPTDGQMVNIFGSETIILEGMRSVVCAVQLILTFTDVPKPLLENQSFPQHICRNCFRHLCVMNTFREKCRRSNAKLVELVAQAMPCETIDHQNGTGEIKLETGLAAEHVEVIISEVIETEAIKSESVTNSIVATYVKRVKCPQCKVIYAGREELKYHIESRHNRERVYKCYVRRCKGRYKTLEALQMHHEVKHSHDGSDEYICTVCTPNRQFDWPTALRKHMQSHAEPTYMCEVCGKKLKTRLAVKNHMLVHTGARDFVCQVCLKAFQTPYTLRVHMRMHTNEKPYVCHVCAEAFSVKCSLNLHLVKHHPDAML